MTGSGNDKLVETRTNLFSFFFLAEHKRIKNKSERNYFMKDGVIVGHNDDIQSLHYERIRKFSREQKKITEDLKIR